MQLLWFIFSLIAYIHLVISPFYLHIHPRDFSHQVSNDILTARDQRHTHGDVCAELMIGNSSWNMSPAAPMSRTWIKAPKPTSMAVLADCDATFLFPNAT